MAEAKIASAIPTATFLKPLKARNGCTTSYAPFFCDYVDRILRSDPAFGATPAIREALLRRGGLTVRTTLSPAAQKAAQASVDGHIPRADPSRKVAAITMVRPGTGEVVAMAQNRSWGTSGLGNTTYNFNVGIKDGGSQGAQAGSTFKAFTLAAALEKGISPYEAIPSPQKGIFDGFANCTDGSLFPPYTVNNSTGAGIFNMFEGAAYSINTYFMALEQRTGLCRPAEIAEALGLRRGDGSPLERVPSFTLGTQEVTPLGMAATYGVIANHGMRCSTIAIAQVTDRDGKDLPIPRTTCERVLDRVVADSVAKILSQVVDGPLPGRTGKAMSLGRPAAGKTGTINDSAAVWFVGFTPDLAAAVATYDPRGGYRFPMKNITIGGRYFAQVFGSTLPGPIWKEAMLGALAASQPALFELLTPESFLAPLPTPSVSPSPSASGSPSPSGSPSASPTPSGSPSPSPTPGPSITPTPTPTPTVPQ